MWKLLLLLFGVLNVGANGVFYPPPIPQCSRHCPSNGCQPVCVSCPENGEITFGSECELDCQNELYPSNRCAKLHDGQCGQHCNITCDEDEAPVCALCDNRNTAITFRNPCELNQQNTCYPNNPCTKIYDGVCSTMCDSTCPEDYAPICALCDQSEEITFGNDCERERQNACNVTYQCTKIGDGECLPAQCKEILCPLLYQPICATCNDGETKTFGNDCELIRQNTCSTSNQCTKISDGPCSPSCDIFCPAIFQPVCAVCADGEKTFGNDCELSRQETCNSSYQCTKIHDGECSPPCYAHCPLIYHPICAQCQDGEKTFASDCQLDALNDCNPSNQCTKIHEGECSPSCSTACPALYKPVCALCEGQEKTFGNDCQLNAQNTCNSSNQCTKIHDGECNRPCILNCPLVLTNSSICVLCKDDEKTFDSDCQLIAQNACNPNDQCTKLYDGQCKPQCNIGCPARYQPICALCKDGRRTFGNDCELHRQNSCNPSDQCTKIFDGACSPSCNIPCPFVYRPICASCNGGEKTFGNACELNAHNTCNPEKQCTKQYEGECKCPDDDAPVCAKCPNGNQTFSNNCYLEQHNYQTGEDCTYVQEGPCQTNPKCARFCPFFDIEVCAICNGHKYRTFPNTCLMDNYNCVNNDNCRNISQGVGKGCPPPSSLLCDHIFCPAIREPVCAQCGAETKTFQNGCVLGVYNCKNNHECTKQYDGECKCPDDDAPVCAKCPNGNQTFSNKCYLEQHNYQSGEDCSYVREGVCQRPGPCIRPCPLFDVNICAKCNGHKYQTFPNTCFMDNYNCENNDNCRNISQGIGKECPPPHPSPSPSSKLCDQIYCPAKREPVCAQCGAERKTFQSRCFLGIHNCKYDHECVKISEGECPPEECTDHRDPICAACSNGLRTFHNQCIFDSYQAFYPQDNCRKQYEGQCKIECLIRYQCLNDSEPICALCGIEERTFDNECIFKSQNCATGNECKKLRDGTCEPENPGGLCPRGCTKEYNPVCAQCPNGEQTFNNLCLLQQNNCQNSAGCNYVRDGQCADVCSRSCPSQVDPICAACANNDYKTFPNTCEMEKYNCYTNGNCQYVSDGSSSCPPVQPGGPIVEPGFPTSPEECAAILCSSEPTPVCARCGASGTLQTFTNGCLLGVHNCYNNQECAKVYDGKCREPPKPTICSINRHPVCANTSSGLKTFLNDCFFKSYAILNPQDEITRLYSGTCKIPCPLYKCNPNIEQPICALCGFEQRTFKNPCLFSSYNCPAGNECIKIKDGSCSALPPLICSGEYEPVCASCSYGFATFANACFMRAENVANPDSSCVQQLSGPCGATCPEEDSCIDDGQPVCGQCGDRKLTFPNKCSYSSYNCKFESTCQILYSGECQQYPQYVS